MRQMLMNGNQSPLTFLKYNKEGVCAKNFNPVVSFAYNAKRIGTRNSAVFCSHVSRNSSRLGHPGDIRSVMTSKLPSPHNYRRPGPRGKMGDGEDYYDKESSQRSGKEKSIVFDFFSGVLIVVVASILIHAHILEGSPDPQKQIRGKEILLETCLCTNTCTQFDGSRRSKKAESIKQKEKAKETFVALFWQPAI